MTDQEIIALQRSGDYNQAFNAIVGSYSERLYWHVRRFLCSHDDTNDLLQDIFIKIWKALPSFKGDSRIYTWIYRIATNEALNALRRQRLISLVEFTSLTEKMAGKIDEDPYFNGDRLQRELHKAIQKLPEKQKLVFNMRYFDEMKYEDIAEITGTSVGALKASYHHAYNKIKAEMEEKTLDV
jgi:RNA polymerase sigma-70 factor (ECF subfamily)